MKEGEELPAPVSVLVRDYYVVRTTVVVHERHGRACGSMASLRDSTLTPVRLGPALPTAQLHLSCAAMTGKSGRLNPPQGNRAPSIAPSLPTAADGMSDPSQAPASAAAATPPAPSPTATGAPPNPPAAARHRKSLSHSSSLRLIAGLLSAARTAVCVCQSQCVCVRVRCVPIKLD